MKKKPDLYKTLGVYRGADAEAIHKAYRARVKKTHPDAGGDPEEFHKVNTAHMVLSDPEKRKRYDETGTWDGVTQDTPEQRAMAIIAWALFDIVQRAGEPAECDLVAVLVQTIDARLAPMRSQRKKTEAVLERTKKLSGRFKHTKKKKNMIEQILSAQQRGYEENMRLLQENIETGETAIAILRDYTFRADIVKPKPEEILSISRVGNLGTGSGFFGSFENIT